jgi:hypothetical protein
MNFKNKNIGDYTMAPVLDELSKVEPSSQLEELNLAGNTLTDHGVRQLISTLEERDVIVGFLDLTSNFIDKDGAELLLEKLYDNRIRRLGMGNNSISNFEILQILYDCDFCWDKVLTEFNAKYGPYSSIADMKKDLEPFLAKKKAELHERIAFS